ncbi:unnamed protein product, partial [Rotaria sp. Silwood1]
MILVIFVFDQLTRPCSLTLTSNARSMSLPSVDELVSLFHEGRRLWNMALPYLKLIGKIFKSITCLFDITRDCLLSDSESGRQKRSSWNDLDDISRVQLEFIARAMKNFRELLTLIFGNVAWIDADCVDDSWEDALVRAQQSASSMGYLLSTQEYNDLMTIPNRCVNSSLTSEYLLYYNRTVYWYSLNITESSNVTSPTLPFLNLPQLYAYCQQYIADWNYSRSLGYSNLIEAQDAIYNNYNKVHKDLPIGICATVTIRIIERITITRQGFDAELTIDNNGEDTLYNVQVTLNIVQRDNQINATDRFSIGQPTINGALSNGNLPASSSAQIDWLIIPYASAAPTQTTWYRVGGQLSYTVGGQDVNITLQPDSIQVEPEASLDIAYFLEENVIGPDPLSNEFIASQPFILGTVITNSGFGSATNFRISSGQPTIIDNKKGLLVSFQMIGMKVNREQQTRIELSATLGDLQPFSTSIVTWTLICSLKGY